ncbi:MAG: hypothetical protein R2695_11920 [Acidimicrobiales bacterium]
MPEDEIVDTLVEWAEFIHEHGADAALAGSDHRDARPGPPRRTATATSTRTGRRRQRRRDEDRRDPPRPGEMARVAVRPIRRGRAPSPLVSVCSGQPADGYAAAGRPPYVVRVPLTRSSSTVCRCWRARRRGSLGGGALCVLVGVAMARFPVLLPMGIVIGLVSVGSGSSPRWRCGTCCPA